LPFLYDLWVNRGKLKVTEDGVGYFTKEDCDPVVWTAFGGAIYPLVTINRVEMFEEYVTSGCAEILKLVRFCYAGKHNFRCGCCIPCQMRYNDGVYALFSENEIKQVLAYRKLKESKETYKGKPLCEIFNQYCNYDTKLRSDISNDRVPVSCKKYFEKILKNTRIPASVLKERKRQLAILAKGEDCK